MENRRQTLPFLGSRPSEAMAGRVQPVRPSRQLFCQFLNKSQTSVQIFPRFVTTRGFVHRVSRAGHELLLTPREFALLAVLVTHCDTALSRSQLLEAAWGYAFIGESRTVDVHINRLRRKLGLQNDIQTVYKVGYRLNSAN